MNELSLTDLARMSRAEAEEAIRYRVQTIYLGNETVLSRVLGRQKLYLSTTDAGFAGHVMLDGYWEIWLTQFFARTLKPGMSVIDVGANYGYYTVLMGDAVGTTGKVLAVEPVPATSAMLARSVALNGHHDRTTIATTALGRAANGVVHMAMPAYEPKNATVVASDFGGAFEVPSTNLDTLAAHLDRVDLIKIDAEGSEAEIIAGMQTIIERHRPNVLLEFNAGRYDDPAAVLSLLETNFKRIRALNFNSELKAVSRDDLLTINVGEDWLLFLEAQ